MSSEFPCIQCSLNVTGRSHALQCDGCDRWQHRKCNTGITHIQYRQMQRREITIDWFCDACRDRAEPAPADMPEFTDVPNIATVLHIPATLHVDAEPMIEIEPTRIPDTSFNVGDESIRHPQQIQDEELEDRPPGAVTTDGPVTYEILEKATRLGARMLLSSDGFTYNVKRENKNSGFIYWVCSVRTKTHRCPAWVKQYEDSYVRGVTTHNHPADPTKSGKLKISSKVLLLFVLMSRRQKRDYVAVFEALLQRLQPDVPNVEWFMLDYEAATWQAIRQVFDRSLIRGCVFHWTQRIYRMVLKQGLSTSYSEGGDVFVFIRKLLALPFLPAEHIPGAFAGLRGLSQQGPGSPQIERLLYYINHTWIEGSVWKPANWSVFRETVRTNNDVEGWHRGLNSRANGSKLPFYVLVPLLRTEAADVNITIRLVSENLVTRNQRTKYKRVHGRLFDMWDKYDDEDDYSTSRLLRESSQLLGLGPIPTTANDQDDDVDQ